jgi:uncharacterized membrane protein YfcA
VSPPQALLAAVIFAAGACVQAAVGFGANLVAAPLLVLLSDRFVPGPVVVASGVLNVLVSRRNGRGMVDPTVGTANAGQVVGTLAAGGVMAMLPRSGLSVLFAGLVLTAVALSAVGFMGTVSGIGGPPIALAYIGLNGPALRATLARFFLVGNLVAIPTLIIVGQLGSDEIAPCLVLVPGAVLGFVASPVLARHLDKRTARPFVLALSTAAAIAVLVRTLI